MRPATSPSDPAACCQTASDTALTLRASRGESMAIEAIMRRYNRLLFRSARGVVGDDAEAQDVVQETYLRAFSTLASFRGNCALGTWLARIAINVALDAQRKRQRSVPIDHSQDFGNEPALEHMMAFNAPANAAPEAQVERGQMRAVLQRAIDSLPPMYRSVFILRAVQEMSVDETAACLQVSAEVVKTRYLRSRSMLRDALGAQIESHAHEVYAFAGARCDAVVAHVLAQLQHQGRIRPGSPG
ncbi:MAG: RNA polymerase sigma factor [Burkholderiaceae bacterium]|nr:RNA polymerase sigma factor [Burkholderiaceae bacterium]